MLEFIQGLNLFEAIGLIVLVILALIVLVFAVVFTYIRYFDNAPPSDSIEPYIYD